MRRVTGREEAMIAGELTGGSDVCHATAEASNRSAPIANEWRRGYRILSSGF